MMFSKQSLFCSVVFLFSHSLFAQQLRSNPEISLNSLILFRSGTESANEEAPHGISIGEVELRMSSNIDPYFRGEFTLAAHPEHHHEEEEHEEGEEEHAGGLSLDVEEAFIETLSLPSVSIRAGKFFTTFGRHNLFHTHSFPFIDAPLSHTTLLGEEGLNEVGISAAHLFPTPWYSELFLQAYSPTEDSKLAVEGAGSLAQVYYLRNLFDLSPSSTMEFGLGQALADNDLTNVTLSFQWRPLEMSRTQSWEWTTEYLESEDKGIATWIQYQMTQSWWLQARYSGTELADETKSNVYSALVGLIPSEYSALRLQYDDIDGEEQRVTLQLNMSMGAHPAHQY